MIKLGRSLYTITVASHLSGMVKKTRFQVIKKSTLKANAYSDLSLLDKIILSISSWEFHNLMKVESCKIFEKSFKVTVVTAGLLLGSWLDIGHPSSVFSYQIPYGSYISCHLLLFTKGVQKSQLSVLLGNRPASLSTKLVIESKVHATLTNLFLIMAYILALGKSSSDISAVFKTFNSADISDPSIVHSLSTSSSLPPPSFSSIICTNLMEKHSHWQMWGSYF